MRPAPGALLMAVVAWLAGNPAALAQRPGTEPGSGSPVTARGASTQDRGTVQLEAGLGLERGRRGTDAWKTSTGFDYGLTDSLEFQLGTAYVLGDSSGAGRGTVSPGLRWQLMEQQGWRPALALQGEFSLPFGAGDEGLAAEIALLASRTTGRGPGAWGLHLDAGLVMRPDPGSQERRHGYRLGAAVSHVIAPDTLLLAGYAQEKQERGEGDLRIVEAGLRRSFGNVTLGLGGGVGLGRDSPRFRLTLGLQYEFDLGGR